MHYPGGELALFARACNWKRYALGRLRPFVRGAVLEVGAGEGANTQYLRTPGTLTWTALEPDPALAARIPPGVEAVTGTLAALGPAQRFDTILYVDVLEHIEDDRAELARAAARLNAGGALIVLAPAHPWLYSPFDAAIGHHRRYTRPTLAAAAPPNLALAWSGYLDSAGMLLSLGNRWLTRQRAPSEAQVLFWDRCVVPVSRVLDALTANRLGKTVIAVWRA